MAVLRENYQQPAKEQVDSTIAADSQVTSCDRFGYQQVIHIHFISADTTRVSDLSGKKSVNHDSVQSAQLKHLPKLVHPDRQAHQ
jgi:hypothetical protein